MNLPRMTSNENLKSKYIYIYIDLYKKIREDASC